MNDDRAGVLASAAWTAAIAARAEPARYRRGKEYVREHAVVSVEVRALELHGAVQGSRAAAYRVVIGVPPLTGPAGSVPALVPVATGLRFSCTCPDWDEPCKHAVAVALAFAEQLRLQPGALAQLRAGDAVAPRAVRDDRRHLDLVRPSPAEPEPSPWTAEVAAFLQSPAPLPAVPVEVPAPVRVGHVHVGGVDLGDLVGDAVHWLSVLYRRG